MLSRRARFGGAGVLSAVVHALVVALLLRLSAPGARAPPIEALPASIAIEITEAPPMVTPPEPPRRRAAGPAPARERRPSPGTSPPRPATAPGPAAAGAPPPFSPATGPATAPVPTPVPAAPLAGSPPPDLSFDSLSPAVRARVASASADAPIASRAIQPGRRTVDDLRAEVERAEDAVANVRAGRADPLLYDYLRAASARFEKDAQRLADDLEVGLGSAAGGWGRGYLARVGDANRGALGARTDAPRAGGGDAPNEPSPHADALGGFDEARRQAEGGAEERRAEVCLDVAPGRDTAARLRRGSGNAALDRLALESFAKAAAARPVPADARRGLACYELRITAYRVPPVPVLGCSFDSTGATCFWPFKKIASVKSRLLSVEYPPARGAQEPGSLLRRPR
jgi:hypothetical protein